MVSTLKDDIERVDPMVRVTGVILESTHIDDTMVRERLLAILSGFFAPLALILAAIGLYGVLNYSVALRAKEIGIRLALGARHWVVIRVVIADILLLTAIGVAIGMCGGLVLARFLGAFLFEVHPSDFWSVTLPLACLLTASGIAAYPAVARAVRVDPAVTNNFSFQPS
jgi:ABC-type antimicrobial peptide transport system permease subunit